MMANELFDCVEKGRLINTFKMFLKVDLLTVIHLHMVCWGYSTLLYMDEAGLYIEKYINVFRRIEDMKKPSRFIEPVKL